MPHSELLCGVRQRRDTQSSAMRPAEGHAECDPYSAYEGAHTVRPVAEEQLSRCAWSKRATRAGDDPAFRRTLYLTVGELEE